MKEIVSPLLKELKDPEGEYKKEFVEGVLRAAKEKPIYAYNPKTFLKHIRGK